MQDCCIGLMNMQLTVGASIQVISWHAGHNDR